MSSPRSRMRRAASSAKVLTTMNAPGRGGAPHRREHPGQQPAEAVGPHQKGVRPADHPGGHAGRDPGDRAARLAGGLRADEDDEHRQRAPDRHAEHLEIDEGEDHDAEGDHQRGDVGLAQVVGPQLERLCGPGKEVGGAAGEQQLGHREHPVVDAAAREEGDRQRGRPEGEGGERLAGRADPLEQAAGGEDPAQQKQKRHRDDVLDVPEHVEGEQIAERGAEDGRRAELLFRGRRERHPKGGEPAQHERVGRHKARRDIPEISEPELVGAYRLARPRADRKPREACPVLHKVHLFLI